MSFLSNSKATTTISVTASISPGTQDQVAVLLAEIASKLSVEELRVLVKVASNPAKKAMAIHAARKIT